MPKYRRGSQLLLLLLLPKPAATPTASTSAAPALPPFPRCCMDGSTVSCRKRSSPALTSSGVSSWGQWPRECSWEWVRGQCGPAARRVRWGALSRWLRPAADSVELGLEPGKMRFVAQSKICAEFALTAPSHV